MDVRKDVSLLKANPERVEYGPGTDGRAAESTNAT
jgi:hypothetical protein